MKDSQNNNASGIQNQIASQLEGSFDSIIQERRNYFQTHPSNLPSIGNIDYIIRDYSNKNAAISLGANLIPGPFGMVAAVPEIVLILKNQIKMIYDIGIAYGKINSINKEILLFIVASAMGNLAGGLAIMHGSKIVVKRASLKVMQQLIKKLAGAVTQKLLKSMVSKWLPIVGAIGMSAWSRMSTKAIGEKAKAILSKDIILENEEITEIQYAQDDDNDITNQPLPVAANDAEFHKILVFIGLIHADNKIENSELEFIKPLIYNSDLNESEKIQLFDTLNKKTKNSFDLQIIKQNANDALPLICDLVGLAKRDGEFHITEKMFIKTVGKELGFEVADLEELFTN